MTIPQELEEFDAFAEAAFHHLGAADHFVDDGGDFGGSEVEFFIEGFDAVEDFGVGEVRVVEGRDLDAGFVDEFGV